MYKVVCFIIILISNFAIAAGKIKIITTIKPIFSILKNITEDFAELNYLSSNNNSAHNLMLRPSDIDNLKSCDMIVIIDKKFDLELWQAVEKLNLTNKIVELSKAPNLTLYKSRDMQISSPHGEAEHELHEDHGHHHGHGEVDFHIWLDINNAKKIAAYFMNKLIELDNPNFNKYEANLLTFYNKCDELNYEIKTILTPVEEKGFIVFHDGYQYFEKQYNLRNLGYIYFDSHNALGLRTAAMLDDFIRSHQITCVLTEPYFNSHILSNIKASKQINIVEIDGEAGGSLEANANTYFIMMKQMAEKIAFCLK